MRKKDVIFDQLFAIAENMRDCGKVFYDYKIETSVDLTVFLEKIKELETKGDTLVHETVLELNHSLITPLDQEDIFTLAEAMDNIVDFMEECAAYFSLYKYLDEDDWIEQFRKFIKLCTEELCQAVEHLVNRKITMLKKHTMKVKSYEEACDAIERKAIGALFDDCTDAVTIIKYKDMYRLLEDTADECQHVAIVLESIVMKNA